LNNFKIDLFTYGCILLRSVFVTFESIGFAVGVSDLDFVAEYIGISATDTFDTNGGVTEVYVGGESLCICVSPQNGSTWHTEK
jgi:hypothetical protein